MKRIPLLLILAHSSSLASAEELLLFQSGPNATAKKFYGKRQGKNQVFATATNGILYRVDCSGGRSWLDIPTSMTEFFLIPESQCIPVLQAVQNSASHPVLFHLLRRKYPDAGGIVESISILSKEEPQATPY